MGQKVNPNGFRVGVIKDWNTRWYASKKDFSDYLVEDKKIRDHLKKVHYAAGVAKIDIERAANKVTVSIHTARPGMLIGKGGVGVDAIKADVSALIGKPVNVNIMEVRNPDANAQLVAENIAQQLEKRIAFRRAMKNAMGRAMRMGALGIKVQVSGRLNGAEIARTEHYHDGTIPLQTLRADIDYGFAEAATTYGRIGVKCWIYKGEVLSQALRTTPRTLDTKNFKERPDRPRRRDGDRKFGDRKPGFGDRKPGFGGQRPQGGYGQRPAGQGFGGQRPQGGFNNRPAAPRPAAPATPKEGGAN